jgi:hypothetical protein
LFEAFFHVWDSNDFARLVSAHSRDEGDREMILRIRRASSGTLALLLALGAVARGEVFTYTIVQNQSQLNLTAGGTAFGGVLVVTEQNATATTRYNGTIATDVTIGGPRFIGAGSANAVNPTGGIFNTPLQFQPNVNGAAGSAPANYGVTMNAPVAFDLPAINIPPELIAALPPPLNTLIPTTLDLGVLNSIVLKVALRDVALQVQSTGRIPTAGTVFDANETQIDVSSGFADINIAARLTQPDFVSKLVMQGILSAAAAVFPDLGITVTSPSLFSLDIDLGFGFRTDLAILPMVANDALADGTITNLAGPPGPSTLVLPVSFSLTDALDEALGDLADIIDLDLQFDFAGQLRATATIPEASSVVMSGMALAGFAVALRRRKQG